MVRYAVAVLALSVIVQPASVAASPILRIDPLTSSVPTAATFSLDVNISDAVDVYGYQFDLLFDPVVLQANSIVEADFLSSGGPTFFIPGFIDNSLGSISFTAATLIGAVSGVSGSGRLATVQFLALAPGSSGVTLENALLSDSAGGLLDVTPISGNAVVSGAADAAVPEPATLVLLGSGLGLSELRRFRRRAFKE